MFCEKSDLEIFRQAFLENHLKEAKSKLIEKKEGSSNRSFIRTQNYEYKLYFDDSDYTILMSANPRTYDNPKTIYDFLEDPDNYPFLYNKTRKWRMEYFQKELKKYEKQKNESLKKGEPVDPALDIKIKASKSSINRIIKTNIPETGYFIPKLISLEEARDCGMKFLQSLPYDCDWEFDRYQGISFDWITGKCVKGTTPFICMFFSRVKNGVKLGSPVTIKVDVRDGNIQEVFVLKKEFKRDFKSLHLAPKIDLAEAKRIAEKFMYDSSEKKLLALLRDIGGEKYRGVSSLKEALPGKDKELVDWIFDYKVSRRYEFKERTSACRSFGIEPDEEFLAFTGETKEYKDRDLLRYEFIFRDLSIWTPIDRITPILYVNSETGEVTGKIYEPFSTKSRYLADYYNLIPKDYKKGPLNNSHILKEEREKRFREKLRKKLRSLENRETEEE